MKREIPNKVYLSESDLPKQWYNIVADMKTKPSPYINPQMGKVVCVNDLSPIFPKSIIEQETATDRYIDIPEPIMDMYRMMRPSPLCRAYRLEKALGTPAKIYYKYEGNNPSGSHKLNSAIPQAYYNKLDGIKRLTTETGAGQWGTALSVASTYYGLECTVYMVKVSARQKAYRRMIMEAYGANLIESPSNLTQAGRKILKENPDNMGSLGIAISEAVEDAAGREDTNYALGSVLNHVCMHQTIIGQEAMKQFEMIDEYPDMVIACCGGGSNFAGTAFPFIKENLTGGKNTQILAVEPSACPTLTKGKFAYDYGDIAGMTPICKMFTLGHDFMPPGIHAGGLRYHGMSPLVSQLYADGCFEAASVKQSEIFKAGLLFAQNEIIVPAPESCHAVAAAVAEANRCKETGEEKTILFTLSGNGYFDMVAYDKYLHGDTVDVEYDESLIEKSLRKLPRVEL